MKIAVVGGGAAGIMAVATLLETAPEAEIFLIEKNEVIGKKVLLTGGGRCNVTTGLRDIREILDRYPRGGKFLNSAMHKFSPEAVYEWFEAHGVPLKIEADQRVFPQSNKSQDIVNVFEEMFRDGANVNLLLNTKVVRVEKVGKLFFVYLNNKKEPLKVNRVIVTTGGQAYSDTGSTGDGYSLAKSFGHKVTPLAPSLSSFRVSQPWPARVAGLSFEKAKLTAVKSNVSFTGPFVFTHHGISGPAVFALSALVAHQPVEKKEPLEISVDLFPDIKKEEMIKKLMVVKDSNPAKNLDKILTGLIPKSLSDIASVILNLRWEKRMDQSGKKEILAIVEWLKGIRLKVNARGGGIEFVTAGGVELGEVNPSTMESKLVSGLFFAGEVLNIDAFTGGFNLQSAWCTGHLAGENCVK